MTNLSLWRLFLGPKEGYVEAQYHISDSSIISNRTWLFATIVYCNRRAFPEDIQR